MDTAGISRVGRFDRVYITGLVEPLYKSNGITIANNQSLSGSVETYGENKHCGLAKLHIDIHGNDIDNNSDEIIASANIIIIKSSYSIMFGLSNNGRNYQSFEEITSNVYELNILNAALEVSKYISKKCRIDDDTINIGIIDNVIVKSEYRRFKISTWIHYNIANIINAYCMLFPSAIILEYGDVLDSAEKEFKCSKEEYMDILKNHYINLGYQELKTLRIKNSDIDQSRLMYKLLIE